MSHSPIPSVEYEDNSNIYHGTSEVSSLRSMSSASGSEQSLDKVSASLISLPGLQDSEKKLRHVGYLIEEMIDTELTYIKALTDVTNGYMRRLQADQSSGFDAETVEVVFSNSEEILFFHEKLHTGLLECNSDHRLVAQLFINKIEKFTEMYIKFCSTFPRSLKRLEQLHQLEPFKSALLQCQRELGHIFALEEYLHRAVQRFLKYPLLFKDMAKKLLGLDGHDVVKEALDKLMVTAVKINSVKRVQELQAHELLGWKGEDLTSLGDLLLEDSIRTVGAKDPRYLFLFKERLFITKKKDSEGIFTYKTSMALNSITLKEHSEDDFLKWTILGQGKGSESNVTLISKDDEQKDRWTREIKRCIVYSTPGLTDYQKEALLLKLPSLKNNAEQVDRLWKRVTKKSKKVKKSDSVRILKNKECHEPDTFSISSEISQAFDLDSPVVINKTILDSENTHSIKSDITLNRQSAVKKRYSTSASDPGHISDKDIDGLDIPAISSEGASSDLQLDDETLNDTDHHDSDAHQEVDLVEVESEDDDSGTDNLLHNIALDSEIRDELSRLSEPSPDGLEADVLGIGLDSAAQDELSHQSETEADAMTNTEDMLDDVDFSTELSRQSEAAEEEEEESEVSEIDNPVSDMETAPDELITGADGIFSFFNRLILESSLYPATVFCLMYIIACGIYFSPWYFTVPSVSLCSYCVYINMPEQPIRQVEMLKKLD